MIFREELKQNSKDQLKGRWGLAILVTLCYGIISGAIEFKLELGNSDATIDFILLMLVVIILLVVGPINVGFSKFLLNFTKKDDSATIGDLFSQFKILPKALGLYLLVTISIVIGTIFFIIPGIIIGLMLSQCYFILAEDNSKSITECMKESSMMMNGYKWDFFVLQLSFIGWYLLGIITCGIAFLWVAPYYSVTSANFYLTIKNRLY